MFFWDFFVELKHHIWQKLVRNKSTIGAATFCKNLRSSKIMIHKPWAKMLLSNQIIGFFDPEYLLKKY